MSTRCSKRACHSASLACSLWLSACCSWLVLHGSAGGSGLWRLCTKPSWMQCWQNLRKWIRPSAVSSSGTRLGCPPVTIALSGGLDDFSVLLPYCACSMCVHVGLQHAIGVHVRNNVELSCTRLAKLVLVWHTGTASNCHAGESGRGSSLLYPGSSPERDAGSPVQPRDSCTAAGRRGIHRRQACTAVSGAPGGGQRPQGCWAPASRDSAEAPRHAQIQARCSGSLR